jgi:hypothetical protein
MFFFHYALVGWWLIAATVWYKTNRRTLPPTRQRAGATLLLGVMIMGIGLLGSLAGCPGTSASENAAMALTGPIYFIIARRIWSLCPTPPNGPARSSVRS